MQTIDKLDISVYNLYAIRTRLVEQVNQQFRLDQAESIPPQTHILNTTIHLSEMELLLGAIPLHTPWAYFLPPKEFNRLRRSPFAFHRVVPSLGSFDDHDKDMAALEAVECRTPQEQGEKKVLTNCFKMLEKLNDMLGSIRGRIGQFLQG